MKAEKHSRAKWDARDTSPALAWALFLNSEPDFDSDVVHSRPRGRGWWKTTSSLFVERTRNALAHVAIFILPAVHLPRIHDFEPSPASAAVYKRSFWQLLSCPTETPSALSASAPAAMLSALPLTLLSLLSATRFELGSSHLLSRRSVVQVGPLLLSVSQHLGLASASSLRKRVNKLQTDTNGSSFIWTLQDTYEGKTFFECVPPHCCPSGGSTDCLCLAAPLTFSQARILLSTCHPSSVLVGRLTAGLGVSGMVK